MGVALLDISLLQTAFRVKGGSGARQKSAKSEVEKPARGLFRARDRARLDRRAIKVLLRQDYARVNVRNAFMKKQEYVDIKNG